MGEESLGTILLNVSFQVINLVLFFWILKKFLGDKILNAVEERKKLLNKIRNAEQEYENKIQEANDKANNIIEEANKHKESIIEEANQLAKTEKEKIIDQANKKYEEIIENANNEAENIKKELEKNWEKGVKNSAKAVINKIFEEDISFQDKYLEKLINDLKK